MKIGVAQTRPFRGDILQNIEGHLRLIELAATVGTNVIVFPELSITGYEPALAAALATTTDDVRLDIFQTLSDRYEMTIGLGIPTTGGAGIHITELIFQPGMARQAYSKRYLHADEQPYFICGEQAGSLQGGKIALAICYELSVPEHSEEAYRSGAEVYLVSVAKTTEGMQRASATLADIAKRYSMTVLVANCVGRCDDFDCGGWSAAWDNQGDLLARLYEEEEGILVLDTETGEVAKRGFYEHLYESH